MMRIALIIWLTLIGCGAAKQGAVGPVSAGEPRRAIGRNSDGSGEAAVPADARAAFAEAYEHIRHERYDQARPILAALNGRYPELDDYVLHFLALAHVHSGSPQEALDRWRELALRHPKSVWFAEAALGRGRLLREKGDLEGARAALLTARQGEEEEVRLAALFELAEIDVAQGRTRPAHEELMNVRREAPGTSLGQKAKRRVYELRRSDPGLEPQGRARRDELRLLVREGDYSAATALADQLLVTAADADRPDLLLLRAQAELGAGQKDKGLATLRFIAERHPRSQAAPTALFRYARLLWNSDRNTEAEQAFSDFVRRYPRHDHAAEALYAIARIEQSSERTERALRSYARLAQEYPKSRLAREARWRIGWLHYRQGRWQEAADAFGRLIAGPETESADAIYWRARSLERAGRREAAEELYRRLLTEAPTTYYAHWAERRLGRSSLNPPRTMPPPPVGQIGPPPAGADPYHSVRARELHASGLRRLAIRELRSFERSHAGDGSRLAFLIDAYRALDGHREVMRLQRGRGRDVSVLYPLAFWPQVTSVAQNERLDPLFVLALIRQESMFDPEARSPADARGLMQLLPSTAVSTARQIGLPSPAPSDLYQPELNIALGVAHLEELLQLYAGDRIKALAAYNGGRRAVAKWDQLFGDSEPDEWVENITYRETRDYVKRVFTNYRTYRELYATR